VHFFNCEPAKDNIKLKTEQSGPNLAVRYPYPALSPGTQRFYRVSQIIPMKVFSRAKNFRIAEKYWYASSLLLLPYHFYLGARMYPEQSNNGWIPGQTSRSLPNGIKGL
jgi:hypothetical protein